MSLSIHDRARILAAQLRCTEREALAELGRRGAEKRRRKVYGVLHPMRADRAAFSNVESPRFWWNRDEA